MRETDISAFGFVKQNGGYPKDLDAITITGIYRLGPDTINYPPGLSVDRIIGCMVFHIVWDDNTMYQLFFQRDIQQVWHLYTRAKTTFDRGWNPWEQIPFKKDLLTREQVIGIVQEQLAAS